MYATSLSSIALAVFGLLALLALTSRVVIVSGQSMSPTIEPGDTLLVERLSPWLHLVFRNQIVAFVNVRDPKHPLLVKRVAVLPHEQIAQRNGELIRIDIAGTEHKLGPGTLRGQQASSTIPMGPEDYFMIGDNVESSIDSRAFGTVQPSEMIGTPILRIYPLARFSILPGLFATL